MKKEALCGLLAAAALALPAQAARTVPVQVDGTRLAGSSYLENGVTYTPLRYLLDAMGGWTVSWDREIQAAVDRHIAEVETMWEEYHKAFIATGGTEEEWAQRTLDLNVTYEIKSQTDTTLSFVVDLSQCSVSASQTQYYYNLDLSSAEGRNITLEDLLGSDWVNICNTAIRAQIDASVDSEGFTYFFTPEEGGFTTVDETTSFYIREDGVPVVVFPEYAIAAGAAGIVECPING